MQIYASRVVNYDASVVNRYDTNSGIKITTLASLFTIVTSFIIQATVVIFSFQAMQHEMFRRSIEKELELQAVEKERVVANNVVAELRKQLREANIRNDSSQPSIDEVACL